MLTINQLMKYLRSKHNIAVKSNQAQDLRNMGYYHGFKGYRFIRVPSQRISFTSFVRCKIKLQKVVNTLDM